MKTARAMKSFAVLALCAQAGVVLGQQEGGKPGLPALPDLEDVPRPVAPGDQAPPPKARIVEETPTPATPEVAPGQAEANSQVPVPKEMTQVAVLGYHDFTTTKPVTEMRMKTEDFRAQMEFIRRQGYSVVSLDDYIAWKKGEKQLPAKCVMITIDDGWKSVYTDAFPILKEYGYPFTLFLYTNFIDNGGATLTKAMLREMQENGASIQSHSKSHPYPKAVRTAMRGGPAVFGEFLQKELGESKALLEAITGKPVVAYCYPGGFNTPEMMVKGKELGYKAMFTVVPKKSLAAMDDMLMPRYMVFGNNPSTFANALKFGALPAASVATVNRQGGEGGAIEPAKVKLPIEVTPAPGTKVIDRTGVIVAHMAPLGDIDPASVTMNVSGFGAVPAKFDPVTKTLTWQPNRPLRLPVNRVAISWKSPEAKGAPKAAPKNIEWQFGVDMDAREKLPQIIGN